MELWQMDVVGGILLADGTELRALTGIDDYSRFTVFAGLMARVNSRSACGHFAASLQLHPDEEVHQSLTAPAWPSWRKTSRQKCRWSSGSFCQAMSGAMYRSQRA